MQNHEETRSPILEKIKMKKVILSYLGQYLSDFANSFFEIHQKHRHKAIGPFKPVVGPIFPGGTMRGTIYFDGSANSVTNFRTRSMWWSQQWEC